jgi:arylsulfatase
MSDAPVDVLVAGYQDLGAAQRDFDVLCGLVKDKQVTTEYGVILVAKDAGGKVTLADTGDHLGRKGSGWGTGVGVVVGLFAPPMLASVVVGAAAGAAVGKFAEHRLTSGIHDKIGEALPEGSAAVIGGAGAAGITAEVGGPHGQQGPAGAEVRAGGGDGQVQPGPHGAADPGPQLRRDDGAHDRPVGR